MRGVIRDDVGRTDVALRVPDGADTPRVPVRAPSRRYSTLIIFVGLQGSVLVTLITAHSK